MKLSIVAVSALVLSTSFAAVGLAESHTPPETVTPGDDGSGLGGPGAGGMVINGYAGARFDEGTPVDPARGAREGILRTLAGDLTRQSNLDGTPAECDGQSGYCD
jgi:hypothetical protein